MTKGKIRDKVPEWMANLLRVHRDTYEPEYDGFLSDHLPMMLLAMHGLGLNRKTLEARHARYVGRLTPAGKAAEADITDLTTALGRRESYRALVRYFDEEINRVGLNATVADHLPTLISGWVRHAFHGTIRLAYGLRFGLESEVSAGLAYLGSAGPDERLATIGRNATPAAHFAWPPSIDITSRRFDAQYEEVMRANTFAVHTHVLDDNKRRVAEDVLGVFNHTQNFFALHMVTGTHALCICADAVELDLNGLMNAGLAAAYLAIGAPNFVADAGPKRLNMDYAHEVKVAFSCADQADRFSSDRYRIAASVYARPFI